MMPHFIIALTSTALLTLVIKSGDDTAFIGVNAIPVDNGVEGEPEIECGPTSVTINFNTRKPFEGHVYVKGFFDQLGCRNDEHGRQVAGIELPFDTCSIQRTRSLNPKGIFVSTTVVISFHPQFVTKVDRAYRIQCFYMEADKTVSSQIEVSEMTTLFQTQIVPMPVCKYEILEGGPSGKPVQFAVIGQHVYHKWTCDSETIDTFCATVHSCIVDDGNGDAVQLLNEEGCALDKFLLNNLEYPTDLMAGQEAHVYKYADRSQLFYQCQISITIKEPHGECPRPKCPEPSGFNAVKLSSLGNQQHQEGTNGSTPASFEDHELGATGRAPTTSLPQQYDEQHSTPGETHSHHALSQLRLIRKRRQESTVNMFDAHLEENVLDVWVELNTMDIFEGMPTGPSELFKTKHDGSRLITAYEKDGQRVCLSSSGFSFLVALGGLLLTAIILAVFHTLVSQRKIAKGGLNQSAKFID